VKLIKQLSLKGLELNIEISPEDKKDITECAVFFEGEGQRVKDLNRTSEFLAALPKGKYTVYKTGGKHLLPAYKGRSDFPFILNYRNYLLSPTFSRGVYPCYNLEGEEGIKNSYLRNRRVYCHRIFAMGFIRCPSPSLTYTVDHLNEDKLDYAIHNLEWVSASDNNLRINNKAKSKGKKYKITSSETYL
tara:strand:- start:2940 stop:3506 length:567 start_codon:yes stop_codon:yes gene_type:complete